MERQYYMPLGNPAGALEEFLVKKARYLETLDQHKYRGYIQKTTRENNFLWNIYDDLAFLENFDLLSEIQGSIKKNRQFGVSVLKVLIPLNRKINLGNQTELNFLERITDERRHF